MAFYFLDTSALVKLYIQEEGTAAVLALTKPRETNDFGILSLAAVELRSALRRRERAGDINAAAVSEILDLFESHMRARFIVQPVTEPVIESAASLVDRHFLRAYDAVQLSACMSLASSRGDCTFTCSDESLIAAARAEGLSILNPAAKSGR